MRVGSIPLLSLREVRHGLTQAFDRQALSGAFLGPGTRVPPGPMSQLLWIWSDSIRMLQFDTAAARRLLGDRVRPAGAVPDRHPGAELQPLPPHASRSRSSRPGGRSASASTVTAVDFPVFQERLARGKFDAYIGAYLDEPSPRGLADQWSRSGWGVLNYGRYCQLELRLAARCRRVGARCTGGAEALARGHGHPERGCRGDLSVRARERRGGESPPGQRHDRSLLLARQPARLADLSRPTLGGLLPVAGPQSAARSCARHHAWPASGSR